jgi:hypothetical protein
LPLHLSVEIDGLYHELEFTTAFIEPNGTSNSVSPAPVVTWEFSVMVKYRFSLPILKPFVEAGPTFRTAGNLNGTSPSNHGFTVGVGVEGTGVEAEDRAPGSLLALGTRRPRFFFQPLDRSGSSRVPSEHLLRSLRARNRLRITASCKLASQRKLIEACRHLLTLLSPARTPAEAASFSCSLPLSRGGVMVKPDDAACL